MINWNFDESQVEELSFELVPSVSIVSELKARKNAKVKTETI